MGEEKNPTPHQCRSFLQSNFVLGTCSSVKYFCFRSCLLPFLLGFLLLVHVRIPHTHGMRLALEHLQPATALANISYRQLNAPAKDGRVCPSALKCPERSEGQQPGQL